MAKPITIVSERDSPVIDEERQLSSAPKEHAAALLDVFDTVQALHDSGVFDSLRGLAGAQKEIIGQLAAAANTPETIRGLRNLLLLAKLLGSIDSDRLERIVTGIRRVMQDSDSRSDNPPGRLGLLKRTRSPDTRRTLDLAVDVLESIGRELAG